MQFAIWGAGAVGLGLASALFGALFAGIFDHHFFDTEFPHFATLYWLLLGLAVAATYIAGKRAEIR